MNTPPAPDGPSTALPPPVVFAPKPSRAPPLRSVGVIGWLRQHIFYSWTSTIGSLVIAGVMVHFAMGLYQWAIADAVWVAESRRECLQISPDGACWAGVRAWMDNFIYGRYPAAERWRVDAGLGLVIAWLLPLWLPRVTAKILIGVSAIAFYPFVAGYLFTGGDRGVPGHLMLSAGLATFAVVWLHTLASLVTGRALAPLLARMLDSLLPAGMLTPSRALLLLAALLTVLILFTIGGLSLSPVDTNLWGGIFLTLVIAGIGITFALPAGVALALARRSDMPIVQLVATAFIELFRSVPLITVLFMAVTMMPLFLPPEFQLNKLVQAIIGVCLFAAAYMAEVVRGGLQAIPSGQYEAAKALGLGYWRSMSLIVLPQSLKLMIPNIVGNFISLLKDTTLVSIIGLYDLLLMLKAVGQNPTWIGLHKEPLVFGAVVFFILCFAMSRYSQRLERTLGEGAPGR